MLSTLDLFLYGFLILFLLPLVVIDLATGSKPPKLPFFTKYYMAETWLGFIGNIFLLFLCAIAINKLAGHLGYVDANRTAQIDGLLTIPFLATLLLFIVFWIKAILKVRRSETSA